MEFLLGLLRCRQTMLKIANLYFIFTKPYTSDHNFSVHVQSWSNYFHWKFKGLSWYVNKSSQNTHHWLCVKKGLYHKWSMNFWSILFCFPNWKVLIYFFNHFYLLNMCFNHEHKKTCFFIIFLVKYWNIFNSFIWSVI